jgi:hypothetical protein
VHISLAHGEHAPAHVLRVLNPQGQINCRVLRDGLEKDGLVHDSPLLKNVQFSELDLEGTWHWPVREAHKIEREKVKSAKHE